MLLSLSSLALILTKHSAAHAPISASTSSTSSLKWSHHLPISLYSCASGGECRAHSASLSDGLALLITSSSCLTRALGWARVVYHACVVGREAATPRRADHAATASLSTVASRSASIFASAWRAPSMVWSSTFGGFSTGEAVSASTRGRRSTGSER